MTSLVVEPGFWGAQASIIAVCGLSSCGTWAELPHDMGDLPGPRIEPLSPALQGGFLTTGPPGKPQVKVFNGPFRDLYTP